MIAQTPKRCKGDSKENPHPKTFWLSDGEAGKRLSCCLFSSVFYRASNVSGTELSFSSTFTLTARSKRNDFLFQWNAG